MLVQHDHPRQPARFQKITSTDHIGSKEVEYSASLRHCIRKQSGFIGQVLLLPDDEHAKTARREGEIEGSRE